jgi:hypothetical protein
MSHLQNSEQWTAQEWIHTGKKYPASDTPSFILEARSEALTIPPQYKSYLPDKKLSIIDFLKTSIPPQASVLVSQTGSSSFSDELPNENLTCLATRPIPPKAWLTAVETAFGQAWFDGKVSIVDFRYKSSRFPLWVLSYWKELANSLEKRAVWKAADQWLEKWGKDEEISDEVDKVRDMMGCLNWGSDVTTLGAFCPKHNLARLLSDKWLDDEIINMTMHDLAIRVRLDPKLSKTIVVATLALQMNLEAEAVPLLYRYTQLFKQKKRKQLNFPTHVNKNHWVAMKLDFKAETLSYGKFYKSLSGCATISLMILQVTHAHIWDKGL